jgi:integrase
MKATASIHFDTRRAKDGNRYPLELRITHLRKRKYYNIGIDLTPKEWEKMNTPKPRGPVKQAKDKANWEVKRADSIIEMLDVFSFPAFERQYFKTTTQTLDLKTAFLTYCEVLNEEKRIGTAESYNSALTSLLAFKKGLIITDITPDFLHRYEGWMQKNGRSLTTVGIYLRSLRTIINVAIETSILKPEQYPFGKRKYQIPTGQNIKKALTLDNISKLYYYPAITGSPKDKTRDFWMFSYLANGMNFKDICRLKFANFQNDTLVFYRAKTERTKRSKPIPIVVIVTDNPRALTQDFISFADCRNKRYALVISDVAKAKLFFKNNTFQDIVYAYSPSISGNTQQMQESAIINVIGTLSANGIGFYVSTDSPNFQSWTLLN